MLLCKHYKEGASVVTHFWVPTNKYIYIYIYKKKKKTEQCHFDTVPLPACCSQNLEPHPPLNKKQ